MDMVLGMTFLIGLSFFLSLVINRRSVGDLAGRIGKVMQSAREGIGGAADICPTDRLPSTISPGPAPVRTLPAGAAAARAKNAADWIATEDYPPEAICHEWEGTTRIALTIDLSGHVEHCYLLESSGHAVLDRAACHAALEGALFQPAIDAQAKAIPSRVERTVTWRLER